MADGGLQVKWAGVVTLGQSDPLCTPCMQKRPGAGPDRHVRRDRDQASGVCTVAQTPSNKSAAEIVQAPARTEFQKVQRGR